MPAGGLKNIVVGVDGSEHASAALAWSVRMAKGMDAKVTAVFAITPPIYTYEAAGAPVVPPQYDPEWRRLIQADFEEKWCRPLREAGVDYRLVMADGRAASVIRDVAEEVDADVIVVGRRGRGGIAELLLGSVSHELVLHSKKPVLVISE